MNCVSNDFTILDWVELEFNKGEGEGELLQRDTAVSTKVVPQKRKSARDNADWYYGKKEFGVDWLRITVFTSKKR